MTAPTIRAALERLIQAIDGIELEGVPEVDDALTAARAALAVAPPESGESSLMLAIDSLTEDRVKALVEAVAATVTAAGGYELGSGNRDGAQIVGREWWQPEYGCDSLGLTLDAIRARLVSAIGSWYGGCLKVMPVESPATPPAPLAPLVDLPPDYIDEWITNPRDRSLLEVFHKACNAEGGSADEVILRGLKAVLHDDLSKSHRLQQENHRFREPERTILCDILANGTLLPDPSGTRYGIPAAPPAPLEGEVGELVAWLLAYRNEEFGPLSDHPFACSLTRTAALLSQLSAAAPAVAPQPAPLAGLTAAQLQVLRDVLWSAQDEGPPGEGWASRQLQELREIVNAWQSAPPAVVPVAVSERLPGEDDRDGEGRCWIYQQWNPRLASPQWTLLSPKYASPIYNVTHWLPAHAIPLPAPQGGEVEA